MHSEVQGGSAPPGVDRLYGPFWIVLGSAIAVGSLRIDRLKAQGVEWFAAPGLLPFILGIVIALCGLLLTLRSLRHAPTSEAATPDGLTLSRVALTLLLCLGFAAGLVGRGLPFGVAAGLYLFTHIALLQWHDRRAAGQTLRGLLVAAAVAVGAGLAVPYVFEELFLVRLP